jgi:hypothetical protein
MNPRSGNPAPGEKTLYGSHDADLGVNDGDLAVHVREILAFTISRDIYKRIVERTEIAWIERCEALSLCAPARVTVRS